MGGAYNVAGGNSSLALGGMQSAVQGMYSVGIAGGSTSAAATQGFAAGYQSAVNVANGTAIGYQAVANTKGTISFGHVKGDTYYAADYWDHTVSTLTFDSDAYNRLVNVADGIDDHDVVVMEQLKNAEAEAVATAKNQIKVKGDEKNVHAEESTDSTTGVQTTTISLKPKVTLQDSTDTTGTDAVVLDGTTGTISAGLSTDAANYISLNGTAGLANIGAITIGRQPSYTYTYYVPVYDDKRKITSLSSTRTTESGNFITGLTNTTWTPGKYASGRAATEDELEQAGRHFLSIKTGTKTDGTTIAENTLANYYNDGATGTYSLAFGVNTKSSGDYATSMGINSTASGLGALAVGYDNTASGTESVSVGTENKAAGNFSVALGVFANAGTANTDTSSTTNGAAVAVGFQASATKTGSSAYGYNAKAVQDEGTALGVSSVANVEGGVAVGAHSIADVAKGAKGYLAGDSDTSTTWVSTAGAMSLGGNTKDENGNAITVSRQITNLAAGTNDTDAVNVAQLKAVESEGLNFQGNNTDTTVHINQGGTLQIQGSGTKASTEYSGENILVTGVSETADDGKTVTTKLNISLDKNIRVDSVTAGQATTDSVQGYAGSVKIVGPSADSTQYEATSLTTAYDTSAKSVKNATVNRLQYTDGDGMTRHTVATLDDGLKLAGDAGTGTVNLDSTLTVTGGETNDANLASGKNIGVTASDGKLQIQLAKNLTGLSSITAGTVVMGSQSDGSDATKTGNYVTGLDNKTWTVGTTQAVSGRAATEDQLQSVSDAVSTNQTNIASNTAAIAQGLNFTTNTTDASSTTGYKVVNKALGDTVSIKAHDAQSGHTYTTNNLTTSIDDSGNITIAMDTQLTADKVTVGTGSKALTLDGSDGTLTTGSSTLNGSGLSLAGGPSITTSGISGGSKQITSVASGASGVDTAGKAVYGTTDNAANIGDVKTIASQMVTVSKDSTKNNTKVTKTTKTDGTVDYEVALNDTLTLGDNGYAVLNGTAGTLSLGTLLFMDGINGYGTIGSLHLGNYSGTDSSWTLTDNKNGTVAAGTYLTGLTNTSWTTADPTYVSGRAATEDELAAVSSTVNAGWKAQINGTTDVKTVTPTNNTLNFVAGDNIALTQNGDIQIATTPHVDFTTVRVGGTGGIYLGSQAGGGANGSATSNITSITGLQNTTWVTNNYMSGRAATEDQLNAVAKQIKGEVSAADVYVSGGSVSYDDAGSGTGTLQRSDKSTGSLTGLHDYYVTGGSVSVDGKTLTLTKNGGDAIPGIDLTHVLDQDSHLVAADSGAYTVGSDGKVTLKVKNNVAGSTPTDVVISGIASNAALQQGLNFKANAAEKTDGSDTYNAQLGRTVSVLGGAAKEKHTYNTDNITTTMDNGTITVKLDDNLTATSLTAGSKTTGVNGMVTATGTGGAYLTMNGADGSLRVGDANGNFAAMVQNYGGPKFLNSTAAGSPRFQYWAASAGEDETTAVKTLYTLATLNDGLQLSGDSGTGSVLLNNTLTVKGGEDSSTDLSSGKNIGVIASGSTLHLQLAKNLTGLTSISLGNDLVLGNQTSGSATGDYLTGLDNITWSGTPVSGRAATEDQLASVSTSLKSKTTGGFGLTADEADSTGSKEVKQDLGSTIKITAAGDENLTTTADTTDTAIKLALSKNLKLTSATYTDTAGNTTSVTGTGITIAKAGSTEGGRVSLTTTGLDNGGSQIVNVASGLGDTALSDATEDTLNHAATIGDLKAAAQGATDSSDAKGLNFVGNSNPSDSSGKTTALHADLGGTVSILGTGTDEDANYSGRNVKVINKNNALYVELDKDLEARSMQVGYGESGNNIQGQLLLYGPNSDNTYSNLIVESQYMDGKPYLTNTTSTGDKRLVYKDGTDDAIHTVATMSDGLKFSGDSGSTAAVTLGSTLAVTGGAAQDKLAKDTNKNLITGNIGVVAAENADGTSGSLTLALAKDINLGSQGSLTADSTKVGYQTATTKISRTNETGNYVTGLTNTTWTGTDYVSGRAATEDQLYAVSQSVQNTVNAATFSITAGGQGEATDATITKKVGESIRIFGDAPKVSGGGDGDGWDRSKANILTKVKKDNKGDEYISVELQDHLEVGTHAGTDTDDTAITGVDGSMLFKGALAADEVNITGDTGVTLNYNGSQAAALRQDNGAGYLDLTGTMAGTKASVSVHTGAKNLAQQDQTRLTYTDQSDKSHDVATMDDGLVVAGDNGQVTRLLNSTLKLSGGETDTTKLSSGQNIGVVADKDNDGQLDIKLAKDLTDIDSITFKDDTTGATTVIDGKGIAITPQNGSTGSQVKLTIDGLSNGGKQITNVQSGLYDTDQNKPVDISTIAAGSSMLQNAATIGDLQTVSNGVNTTLTNKGLGFKGNGDTTVRRKLGDTLTIQGTGADSRKYDGGANVRVVASDTTNTLTIQLDRDLNAHTMTLGKAGAPGVDGETGILKINGQNKDGSISPVSIKATYADTTQDNMTALKTAMSRITYDGGNGHSHTVATLEDGLQLSGDNGEKANTTLNKKVTIKGGVTRDKLVDNSTNPTKNNNIGVIASQDTDGNTTLSLQLAKDITGLNTVTAGTVVMGNQKVISAGKVQSTGNYVTGLENTTWDGKDYVSGRAATEDQLKLMQSSITSSITQSVHGGGFALSSDEKGDDKIVKQDLGKAIQIKGDTTYKADGSVEKVGNIKTSIDNGAIKVGLNKDVDLGKEGSIKAGGVTIDNKGIDAGGKNITNVKSGIVKGDDSDNTNAANIGDVHTIVDNKVTAINNNVSDIKNDVDVIKKTGRTYQGDDKKTVKVDFAEGKFLSLTGGANDVSTANNIGVMANGENGLAIRLAKKLNGLESVTTGKTTMDDNGLTIAGSDGKAGTTVTGSGIKIASGGEGTYAVEVSNSNVSMGGQQIHYVAPGTAATDAVNVSQLSMFADNVDGAINKLDNRVNRVGAGAAALAALHPLDFDPDDKWDFAAGFGNYKNANAAAIGAYYRPNEDTMFSVGGSFGGGENMVNAGVSFKLGQGNHVSTSRVAMGKEILDLRKVVAKQDGEIQELKQLVNRLAGQQVTSTPVDTTKLFPDIPRNHWAYVAVHALAEQGILTGYPNGNFEGDRMMTRYEFAEIVYKAMQKGLDVDEKLVDEFEPELSRIRVDVIAKDAQGNPTIERVRVK
ncbi:YadA-like family protein [Megasphaera sp.]|uniref:YadA-like family protein n=1 Tax=Megasphaera sp. TaxID=2023260 RepID=UPI002580A30C|nr:YadA-like family protein [Megasphaera sp.]